MEEEKEDSYAKLLRQHFNNLKQWVKPDPADPLFLKIVKLIYKSIAVLLLIAASPVIIVLLIIIFFATL